MSKETMYTPFCECRWAFLQLPKPAQGKFRSAFEITLVLDKKEHAELLRQISSLNKDAGGPSQINEPKHPIKAYYEFDEVTNDSGERVKQKRFVDGKYLVRFKSFADTEHAPDHINTFDSQGNIINREKNFVANGSIVSVAWTFGTYENSATDRGLSLYLDAVQIKELIEWKGKDFEDLGFEKVQGYVSGDKVETADGFPETTDDGEFQDGSPVEDETSDLSF
jgi:hypothetical protein